MLTAGTRVRLHAPSPVARLSVDTGTVVRPDLYGCYIVRLDGPWTDDRNLQHQDIRESEDNLTILGLDVPIG